MSVRRVSWYADLEGLDKRSADLESTWQVLLVCCHMYNLYKANLDFILPFAEQIRTLTGSGAYDEILFKSYFVLIYCPFPRRLTILKHNNVLLPFLKLNLNTVDIGTECQDIWIIQISPFKFSQMGIFEKIRNQATLYTLFSNSISVGLWIFIVFWAAYLSFYTDIKDVS